MNGKERGRVAIYQNGGSGERLYLHKLPRSISGGTIRPGCAAVRPAFRRGGRRPDLHRPRPGGGFFHAHVQRRRFPRDDVRQRHSLCGEIRLRQKADPEAMPDHRHGRRPQRIASGGPAGAGGPGVSEHGTAGGVPAPGGPAGGELFSGAAGVGGQSPCGGVLRGPGCHRPGTGRPSPGELSVLSGAGERGVCDAAAA